MTEREPVTISRDVAELAGRLVAKAQRRTDDERRRILGIRRKDLLEAARAAPLSVAHRYRRVAGHEVREHVCPPEDEWDFWLNNALDYLEQQFCPALLQAESFDSRYSTMEAQCRAIMLQRLQDWRFSDSGRAVSGPAPRRSSRAKAGSSADAP